MRSQLFCFLTQPSKFWSAEPSLDKEVACFTFGLVMIVDDDGKNAGDNDFDSVIVDITLRPLADICFCFCFGMNISACGLNRCWLNLWEVGVNWLCGKSLCVKC